MTTITVEDKRTTARKLLFEMAKLLSEKPKDVVIFESDESPYNPDFVKMIKESASVKKRHEVNNLEELWESL